MGVDRPADQPAGGDVDDRGQIQPAATEAQVGDVAAPPLVGCGSGEVPADRIRHRRRGRIRDARPFTAAKVPAHDLPLPHDPLDPLAVDPHTLVAQFDGHPRRPVGAAGVDVDDPEWMILICPASVSSAAARSWRAGSLAAQR